VSSPPAETPRRGRPPVQDLDRIVSVAAAMDPGRLTMAAVAAQLDVSPSALYRWVADRDALLDLVSATMARRILPTWSPGGDDWQDWLLEWAHNVRREFTAVPGFALRVLTGPHREAGHTALEQAATRAFVAGGATPDDARQYWYVFSAAVVGWITVEQGRAFPASVPMDFDVLLEVLLRGTGPDR
jgi:AcrR family transcriptional regulator